MNHAKRINLLGFLSLPALIGILGFTTENQGLWGFFGFAVYLRYFWVLPDELFLLNVQKACTFSFLSQLLSLVPGVFICMLLFVPSRALPIAFGLSFSISIFVFTIALLVLEHKESTGAQ